MKKWDASRIVLVLKSVTMQSDQGLGEAACLRTSLFIGERECVCVCLCVCVYACTHTRQGHYRAVFRAARCLKSSLR